LSRLGLEVTVRLGWLVTGYDEARVVLDDQRFSNRMEAGASPPIKELSYDGKLPAAPPGHFLAMDDPEHARHRRLVTGQCRGARRAQGRQAARRPGRRAAPQPRGRGRQAAQTLRELEETMKVFVAGATGAIGTQLIPRLVAAGHQVTGMTRWPDRAAALHAVGATAAVADGLDRAAVRQAVLRAEPEAVIHQMTSLSGTFSLKKFDEFFARTNRLRTQGLDYLLEAAQAAGARRFLAQSQSNGYAPTGALANSEADPLDPDPPAAVRRLLAAIGHLEAATLGAAGIQGLVLRYGNFYGPGTGFAPGGVMVELVGKRRLPIIGDGGGVWSFIHTADAAAATVAALERGAPGVYNLADDQPAPVRVWLPELARVLGAKPPLRVPVWLGRLAVGEAGVWVFTRIRGAANAKAKRELGWQLQYPSWRDGFRHDLAAQPNGTAA
jgi:2-alkyl-3-oxoalkanoate reductase